MLVLVANLGSTSFKHKLFDMPSTPGQGPETCLAEGSADRIGSPPSHWWVQAGEGRRLEGDAPLADHGQAIQIHLEKLTQTGTISGVGDIQAIGFKAVHGGNISDAVRVDGNVLATLESFSDVAPQHNPPYIAAMKAFGRILPDVPQVAAFETAFHQTIPQARRTYAIPWEWTEKLSIRRYGFHGASHRYIAQRMSEIAPQARRVISCHLGGSSSICAIESGVSIANSFGMTVQTGVVHGSRVGDFDSFALLKLLGAGIGLADIFRRLGREGGLAGISGLGSDLRQIEKAADAGHARARLAIEVFVESIRHYVGAYLAVLGGADALVFTGGIGQNSHRVREAVCRGMAFAGIRLDEKRSLEAQGTRETSIEVSGSPVAIWVMPTNEELIVARQTVAVLGRKPAPPNSETL